MPRSYRINVRFDPEDPEEAEVLRQLRHTQEEKQCSLSQVIVSILKDHLTGSAGLPFSLEDIRQILREELEGISISPSAPSSLFSTENLVLSAEEQEQNDRSVLEDLEMFG